MSLKEQISILCTEYGMSLESLDGSMATVCFESDKNIFFVANYSEGDVHEITSIVHSKLVEVYKNSGKEIPYIPVEAFPRIFEDGHNNVGDCQGCSETFRDNEPVRRLSACKKCRATENFSTGTSKLFRVIHGKMYCGDPKVTPGRNQQRFGSGKDLEVETMNPRASCPLKFWDVWRGKLNEQTKTETAPDGLTKSIHRTSPPEGCCGSAGNRSVPP